MKRRGKVVKGAAKVMVKIKDGVMELGWGADKFVPGLKKIGKVSTSSGSVCSIADAEAERKIRILKEKKGSRK